MAWAAGCRPALAPLTFKDIVDVPIETAADSWSYALFLQLDAQAPDSTLAIEVGVQVVAGKLGIAACGEDISRFCAPERTLAAMAESQRVVIKAPGKDIARPHLPQRRPRRHQDAVQDHKPRGESL